MWSFCFFLVLDSVAFFNLIFINLKRKQKIPSEMLRLIGDVTLVLIPIRTPNQRERRNEREGAYKPDGRILMMINRIEQAFLF